MSNKKFLIKLLSNLLYPFNREKKKLFRARHDETADNIRKLRKRGIKIGFGSFIYHNALIRDKNSVIGKYCSIAPNVRIGTGQHPLDGLSTNSMVHRDCFTLDGHFGVAKEHRMDFKQTLPVTVGNDVWIGANVIIMDGITIGDGAVIGSGAIVTKDIPPYAVAVGVPAKVIRYRFDQETVERLIKSAWWDRPVEFINSLPVGDINKSLELLEADTKNSKE